MLEENRGSDEWHYELWHGHHRQDSIGSVITLDHVTDDSLATHSVRQAKEKGTHVNKQNSLLLQCRLRSVFVNSPVYTRPLTRTN